MNIRPINPEIIRQIPVRKVRICLRWRSQIFPLGTFELKTDGSFVYIHDAMNRPDLENKITTGLLRQDGVALLPSDDSTAVYDNDNGVHVTLHPGNPPYDTGVLHIRTHSPSRKSVKTIHRKSLVWFPVTKAFTSFIAFAPTMKEFNRFVRAVGGRQTDCIVDVPSHYEGSLRMPVDVFPHGTEILPARHGSLGNFFGYSGEKYFIRAEVVMSASTIPASIIWPEDDDLELVP